MPNFCAAPNCTRKSTQSDLAFFRFPRDPSRCEKWVENCRRYDLEDKTPDQLNKHYRLCAQHFEDSMICRSSPYRTVLRENAIPTIFDLTSHLGNPGRRRKRIKELSEEEIRTLKERKRTEMVFGLHHSFLMASKSFLDIELLIALVRLHPELYDPLHSSYYDAARRATIWNQIASEIFMDWEDLNPQQRAMKAREVQTQWQSLKENFRRELSMQTRQEFSPLDSEKPRFSHFKELLFLQPLMVVDENYVQPPTAASSTNEGVDENAAQPPTVTSRRDERVDENVFRPQTAAKRTVEEDDVQIIYIKKEPPSPPSFTKMESEDDGPSDDVVKNRHHQEGQSIEELRIKGEEELLRVEREEELRIEREEELLLRVEREEQQLRIEREEQQLRIEREEEELRIEGEEELRIEGEEEDPHMDFAQSLVPYLAQVPDGHQASLRMALTNLVFCYIENTQGRLPAVSPRLRRYIYAQDDPLP